MNSGTGSSIVNKCTCSLTYYYSFRGSRGRDRMVVGFVVFNVTFNNISVISWW